MSLPAEYHPLVHHYQENLTRYIQEHPGKVVCLTAHRDNGTSTVIEDFLTVRQYESRMRPKKISFNPALKGPIGGVHPLPKFYREIPKEPQVPLIWKRADRTPPSS